MTTESFHITARADSRHTSIGFNKTRMASRGVLCRFFNAPQGCRNGARCRFIHDNDAPPFVPICRFYGLPKGCRYGDHCMYQHDKSEMEDVSRQVSADVLQKLENLSLKGSDDLMKQSCPILDLPDFDPDEVSLDPEVDSLMFTGQLKYDSSVLGRTKWKHGTLKMFRDENSWWLGLHFDYLDDRDDCKPVLTIELECSMLKRVVCKLSGVTIYCQYEGAECIIDYRPSVAANVQGIYAVFADIIHPDVEEVTESISTDSRVVNMKHNDGDDEENEDDDVDNDDDDDDENSDDDNYDEQEEELSDADDDSLDDPFEKEIREQYEKWKVEVLKMTTVHCGVCLAEFTGQSPFDKLKDHYYDKLTHKDFKHRFFILAGCPWLQESTECVACGRHFGHGCSLMQHMFDKSRRVDVEGDQHRMMTMKGVVEPICYKRKLKKLQEEIGDTLLQDTREQDFQEMLGFAKIASSAMRCPNLFGDSDLDDSDDYDKFNEYLGSDEYQLLCQGIKPLDPEAGAALAVLNGW
ncbi:uncharacterized protein LOC127854996 isoform X3 [Dreissena polymorpha]|uniref:uncharacterized protein LOC127854996 isoform X3 n=1 Tax=Dreissena polymorpha TaxID=45954 RepID=UPI0022654776|nr:uncharacterized protein LOC127854996 isoform X3 [Dreissena polymorpha]